MKALARSYVWWPKIDSDIETHVAKCSKCQEFRHAPPQAPVHPWEVPRQPWSRLHVDFAGPYQGQNFLIIVDAYSKWLEVKRMTSTTAAAVIVQLRDIFATHGIPDSIVSDNGPQFTSEEYQTFLEKNLIRSILVSPYHASSNGQAERMVQTFKDALKRITHGTWNQRLANFLLSQHVTPNAATGLSPAELLMGRRLRTCLDRLHSDYVLDEQLKRDEELAANTKKHRTRQYTDNSPVYIRSYGAGSPWIPATVQRATGPVSYEAKTPDGRLVRRHIDLMQSRSTTQDQPVTDQESPRPVDSPSVTPVAEPQEKTKTPTPQEATSTPRPQRTRMRPVYLKDYVTS